MPRSVQFGRAQQSFIQRWLFLFTLILWCLLSWFFVGEHHWETLIARGLPLAMIAWWYERQMNKAARCEPGWVTFRTGRKQERIPASKISGITVVETPGWVSRSVYVRIERGRFDSFDLLNIKARNTPEGRGKLQMRVDEALRILHSDQ